MRGRVSGRRPGRARLATALLGHRLEPWVFPVVGELVDELSESGGTLPPSSLFSVRVLRSTLEHSRGTMIGHPQHGLALTRLALLLAPHLPSRTPHEAQHALFLEGEAWRLHAAALFRLGRNYEAQRAAEEARRFFRIPIVKKAHRKQESILDLTAGQIVFHLDDIERGLEIVSRAADQLHIIHFDTSRFLKGRAIYGSLLMSARRWWDAIDAFGEVLEIAIETNDLEVRRSAVYNISVCGMRLREDRAEQCNASALNMLKKEGVDLPFSGWRRAIDLEQKGMIESAISELYAIRQGYFDAGLELIGHVDVTPTIVELLVGIQRFDVAQFIGRQAIRKLSEAGLKYAENRIRKALKVAPPEGGATLKQGN